MKPDVNRGRRQLILLAIVFLGPLVVAAILYFTGWRPMGTTEHGRLIQPTVMLPDVQAESLNGTVTGLRGRWVLIYTDSGECSDICRATLVKIRQVHRALGKEMSRVQMLFCIARETPNMKYLAQEHPALLLAAPENPLTQTVKTQLNPEPGEVLLADTLGNILLRFPPQTEMRDMHEDVKKVLKLSRIG